jgi:hypothetical protein
MWITTCCVGNASHVSCSAMPCRAVPFSLSRDVMRCLWCDSLRRRVCSNPDQPKICNNATWALGEMTRRGGAAMAVIVPAAKPLLTKMLLEANVRNLHPRCVVVVRSASRV